MGQRGATSCELWLSQQGALGPPATHTAPPRWIWGSSAPHLFRRGTPAPCSRSSCVAEKKPLVPGAVTALRYSRKMERAESWRSAAGCRKQGDVFEGSQRTEKSMISRQSSDSEVWMLGSWLRASEATDLGGIFAVPAVQEGLTSGTGSTTLCTAQWCSGNQKTSEIKESLLSPSQGYGKISSLLVFPPNKSRVWGFSKENHCSSASISPVMESHQVMRKGILPCCAFPSLTYLTGSQLFHTCKPIFKPFLKASDRSNTNSYYCSWGEELLTKVLVMFYVYTLYAAVYR